MQQIKNIILKIALPFLLGVAATFGYLAAIENDSSCPCAEKLEKIERTVSRIDRRVKRVEKAVVVVKKDEAAKQKVNQAPQKK